MRPDLTPRELIRHLATKHSQTGDVVELLETMKEPVRPKEVAEQYPVDRGMVHEICDPLEPWGIKRINNGHRKLTTAGETSRQAFATAVEAGDSDDLAWLARSENRKPILDYLQEEGPVSGKNIAANDDLPSKRTAHRTFEELEDRGWANCEEQNGSRTIVARLTMDGERAIDVYGELLLKMTQAIEKAPCLRDLYLECADIPLDELDDAEIVEATPENPFEIENRIRDLSNADFHHFRGFQSHWNGDNAKAYIEAVKEGKEFEVVSPPLGLDEFPTSPDEVECVVEGLKAENYRWLMHTDELPCSLVILDREQVVIGPRDPSTTNDVRTGAIISHNDELVSWAMDMYETHRKQAKEPFDISIGLNIGMNGLIDLLTNRHLSEDSES
jgi:predicted transcriptional regulator